MHVGIALALTDAGLLRIARRRAPDAVRDEDIARKHHDGILGREVRGPENILMEDVSRGKAEVMRLNPGSSRELNPAVVNPVVTVNRVLHPVKRPHPGAGGRHLGDPGF